MDSPPRITINANTGISIGIIISLIIGIIVVMSGINAIKSEIASTQTQIGNAKTELTGRMDKFDTRLGTLESGRNSWTSTDMFKWAVHLQQANPQIKVPEPETGTK